MIRGVIIENEMNDVLCGGNGIIVVSVLSTLVDGELEREVAHQFGFITCIYLVVLFPPPAGDDHDIPKGAFATELLEHLGIHH